MPLTITFAIPIPTCEHLEILATAAPSGRQVLVKTTKPEIRTPLSLPEQEQMLLLILRAMVMQMTSDTPAAIRTALQAKTVNLTLSG